MKVAVSIPDPVFKAAEKLAKRQRKSRSQLYAEAIAEYVSVRESESVTERLNAVYANEESGIDPELAKAQFDALPDEQW